MSRTASWRPTPNNRFTLGQSPRANASPISPGKRRVEENREESGLYFKSVVGTTTRSANAFNTEDNSFVCCAGPAVVLSQVDENLNSFQRLFRARPNVRPINATQSFYNQSTPPNTPAKSRNGSPLKTMGMGWGPISSADNMVDSPGHGSANNRSREATCVSMSHKGNLLAIGETGYNPRVLLFSTKTDAPPDIPLSVLTDHSFGVSSVAFSDDAHWLCTLGNSYDGFILIYSISPATGAARLQFSNKISNANFVFWMGSNVVSIGIRHVKVWRVEQPTSKSPSKTRPEIDAKSASFSGRPTPKRFLGRNSLLGPLIDSNFVHAVAVSHCCAVLCTIHGDICLLDDTYQTQQVKIVARANFKISCITFESQNGLVWFAGEAGTLQSIALDDLTKRAASPDSLAPSSPRQPLVSNLPERPDVLAIGVVRDQLITVSSDVIAIGTAEEDVSISSLSAGTRRLPAHGDAVLGICSLLAKPSLDGADFLTFSKNGRVLFWKFGGSCTNKIEIPLDQPNESESPDCNELKTLTPSLSHNFLLTGDKCGVLRLIDCSGGPVFAVQAHIGEINGVATGERKGSTIIASCGRDRTIQVFQQNTTHLDILQTLDDHAASVTNLMFLDGASTLLSMSSDRTISIRKWACGAQGSQAYISVRIITLKASPISFTHAPEDSDLIIVSTLDRQIQKYDISSGRLLHSFKITDGVSNESILMNSLKIEDLDGVDFKTRLLIGVSPSDKTIRVHDYESGSLLTKEYGQTTISAIGFIQGPRGSDNPQQCLVSCGLDGTVIIWGLNFPYHPASTSSANSSVNESMLNQTPVSTHPQRRILSRSEISNLQNSLESDSDAFTPMRSPTRLRRKTSKFSMAAAPKLSIHPQSTTINDSSPPANGNHDPKSSRRCSSKGSYSQNRVPNLKRRQSKSVANLNDLNDTAKHIADSLHSFRNRITSAAIDKLDTITAQELESELKLTTRAIRERFQIGNETMEGDHFDDYLAKMIDERLALKARSDQARNDIQEGEEIHDTSQNSATAGAKDGSLDAD